MSSTTSATGGAPSASGSPERPAAPASAAEAAPVPREKTVKEMVNEPGFLAFLGKATKGIPFNYEADPAATKKYYDAFKSVDASANELRKMLVSKIQEGEKGGAVVAEDAVKLRRALERQAAESPDSVIALGKELENIQKFPERKAETERQFAEARQTLERTHAELQSLIAARSDVEAEYHATPEPTAPEGFLKRVGGYLKNKFGYLTESQQQEFRREGLAERFAELDRQVTEHQATFASGALTVETLERQVTDFSRNVDSLKETILGSIMVRDDKGNERSIVEETRNRLSTDVAKKFDKGLETNDIMALSKLGQDLRHFEGVKVTGADYLSGTIEVADASGKKETKVFQSDVFRKKLTEKIEGTADKPGILTVAIKEALASIPAGATEMRMESAVQKFITLASTGIGAKDRVESTWLVIDAFQKALDKAVDEGDETGKAPFLVAQISRLERTLTTS